MSTRRPHTKSRRGCKRCKGRRMKCDEIHPICSACQKAGVACDFGLLGSVSSSRMLLRVAAPPVLSADPSSAGSSTSSSPVNLNVNFAWADDFSYIKLQRDEPAVPQQIGTPSEGLIDLKLFHHYIEMMQAGQSSAQDTMDRSTPNTPVQDVKKTWSDWIIRLAMERPHVMHALLASSAFHLRHVTAAEPKVTEAAHRYMVNAIAAHSAEVQKGITASNAEAAFAVSTFIAFHITSEKLSPGGSEEGSMMHWFQPWDGIRSLFVVCWGLFRNEEIKRLIRGEYALEAAVQEGGLSGGESLSANRFDFLLDGLDEVTEDPETFKAYATAVYYLNKISSVPLANVLQFSRMAPKRFVELVAVKDPRAMTIVGYHLMLIKQLDQVWWLQGSAERDFGPLMDCLPVAWRGRMGMAVEEFERSPGKKKEYKFSH